MPRRQTPITFESFNSFVLPQIKKMFQEMFDKYDKKIDFRFEEMNNKIESYRQETIIFKIEVIGEIKTMREELAFTLNQYRRIDKRVTRVEKHVGIALSDA